MTTRDRYQFGSRWDLGVAWHRRDLSGGSHSASVRARVKGWVFFFMGRAEVIAGGVYIASILDLVAVRCNCILSISLISTDLKFRI